MKNAIEKMSHRKYQLTINNPMEKGLDHEIIKLKIKSLTNLVYFCMCDEIGESGTYHTHVYVYYKNAKRFSTIKTLFPEAHIESAKGSSKENRDYIRKEGKHKDSEKNNTNLSDTFEEEGELPDDGNQGQRTDMINLISLFDLGMTPLEIVKEYPHFQNRYPSIERLYHACITDKHRKIYRRNIHVIYLFGPTGSGKTSGVLNEFEIENTAIVNCLNKNLFDDYKGQDVLLLDEFFSSFPITSMNQLLDIYPYNLPCRYNDKVAMYNTVIICSNKRLDEQYSNIQYDSPEVFQAFLRRIHEVRELTYFKQIRYHSVQDSINNSFKKNSIDKIREYADVELKVGDHAKKALKALINEDLTFRNYEEVFKEILSDKEIIDFVNLYLCEEYKFETFDIERLIKDRFNPSGVLKLKPVSKFIDLEEELK